MRKGKGSSVPNCTICKISGKQVRVSLHYGAHSCQACSLFFRRQAAKQTKDACVSVFGNCLESEDSMKKNSCKACRFQACKDQGMNPELVDCKKKWNPEGESSRPRLGGRGRVRKRKHCVEDEKEGEEDELRVEEDGLSPNFAEVLGFFITVPGRVPRWIELNDGSITSALPQTKLSPFSTSTSLAKDLENVLQIEVPVVNSSRFPYLVSKDVTPTQVKSVITYGVRRLYGEKIQRTEPLNLSKELCELELNVIPGDRRHKAIPKPDPEPKRLPNFSNLMKPVETQTRENSEPKINIQEFVAQYDFNNDKFDRIVFDLKSDHSENGPGEKNGMADLVLENQKISPEYNLIPERTPEAFKPSGVIKFQGRRLRQRTRPLVSETSTTNELKFSDF